MVTIFRELLIEYTERRPFRPFRIQLIDGDFFKIREPDAVISGSTMAAVGPSLTEAVASCDPPTWRRFSYDQIEAIEPLTVPAP